MSQAAGAAGDIDGGRLSRAQRALVVLTALLVVAALVLFVLQGGGGKQAAGRHRVVAAPVARTPTTLPATTLPATTLPTTTPATPDGTGTPGQSPSAGGSPASVAAPTDTTSPPDSTTPPDQGPAPDQGAAPPATPSPSNDPNAAATPAPNPASWYVSFHGGDPADPHVVNNVLAYDAGGAPLPMPVLQPGTDGQPLDVRELRTMAFNSDGIFFVVNSYQADSKVLAFGGAGPDGTRPLIGAYSAPTAQNPGIQHPYGLVFDGDGNALIASQDSQVVTDLYGPASSPPNTPGTPTPTASNWPPSKTCTYFPGTFAPGDDAPPQLCTVPSDSGGLKSPRAVVYDSGNKTVYVADNGDSSVKAYDAATGDFAGPGKGKVMKSSDGLAAPVGLVLHNGILYVTDEQAGDVLALDLIVPGAKVQEVVKKTEGSVTLDHPSGLAFGPDGALYVASRTGKQVERYELTGDGAKVTKATVFLDKLPDEPEQILSVPSS